jgi:hypothetical protein
MFIIFQPYDDEGYHLLTVRSYLSGHALYSDLATYYGPFFYEIVGGFFKLTGFDITNDSGRLVTLFVWLMVSLAGGLAVYQLTRSLLLAVSAQLLTFNLLAALTNEPMQPGGLVSVLLSGLVLTAAYRSRRPRATAVFIGALVAAAVLVKINVGAFAAVAVAFAFAGSLTGRWRRLLLPASGMMLTVAPFAVMARLLDRDWALNFALAAALAAAALTVAMIAAGPKQTASAAPRLMIGGGFVVAIAVVGVVLLGGTRLSDLAYSMVIRPFRQPLIFVIPFNVRFWVVVCAAASLAFAIAFAAVWRSRPLPLLVIATARIAVGVVMWICVLLPPSYLLMLAVPLVWVAALEPRDDQGSPTDSYARLLLPALAVMEILQAYPVAGTQVSIGSLGVVFVGAITLNDGVRQLRALAGGPSRPRLVAAANFVPVAALILTVAATSLWASVAAEGYTAGSPSGLQGAGLLRLAPKQQTTLASLSVSVRRICTSFVTMPGMASLYIWTGQEAPAPLFDSDWMFFLDTTQQQSIVDQVRSLPGMCVIRNDAVLKFWAEGQPVPRGPLMDFVESNFVVVGSYGDYELLVMTQPTQ